MQEEGGGTKRTNKRQHLIQNHDRTRSEIQQRTHSIAQASNQTAKLEVIAVDGQTINSILERIIHQVHGRDTISHQSTPLTRANQYEKK